MAENRFLRSAAGYRSGLIQGLTWLVTELGLSAGFLPLGLPADDPFWNAPDADWTSLKLWKGIDLPADHAVN